MVSFMPQTVTEYHSDGKCPKCGCRHYRLIRRGRRKCIDPDCRREYSDSWGTAFLDRKTWWKVADCFVRQKPLSDALKETSLKKLRYLRALKDIRNAIHRELVIESTAIGHATLSRNPFLLATFSIGGGASSITLPFFKQSASQSIRLTICDGVPQTFSTITARNQPLHEHGRSKKLSLQLFADGYHRLEDLLSWKDCYCDSGVGPFIDSCVIKRRGINLKAIHLHIAEAIWRSRHRGTQYLKKSNAVHHLMERMRNPTIGYSKFSPPKHAKPCTQPDKVTRLPYYGDPEETIKSVYNEILRSKNKPEN